MLKKLEMIVIDVCMVWSIHLHKYNPLKPPKLSYVWCVTLNLRKYDTLFFLQKGPKHLDRTHGINCNVCDDNIQDQSRLQNLVQGNFLEGVVTMTILHFLMVLGIYQPRGSPRCEVPIRLHTIWNRSPIRSISLVAIFYYRFSLALTISKREKCICSFAKIK